LAVQSEKADESPPSRPGVAVDAAGGAVIDPTENVIALVKAGEITAAALRQADQRFLDAQLTAFEKLQNFAREAESRFQNFARDSADRTQTAIVNAETRRIDQLAAARQELQDVIRDMLAESARSTSQLVRDQLVQINSTFDSRLTKLEQAQLTQAGRSSVADPAISDALARMNRDMNELKLNQDTALNNMRNTVSSMQTSEGAAGGRSMGRTDSNARMLAVVMAVSAVATPIVAVIAVVFAMHGVTH
jgi:hypothetical protein